MTVDVSYATNRQEWDAFLSEQQFPLFLQAWAMGDVYRDIGQEPIRLIAREGDEILGICQAIVVPARRGKHVMVQYGPAVKNRERGTKNQDIWKRFVNSLSDIALEKKCGFLRLSPFLPLTPLHPLLPLHPLPSPLHLLSEYTWYIPLKDRDRWEGDGEKGSAPRSEQSILSEMRKTTRNLIGRAEREGVTVTLSNNPNRDLDEYFRLQQETFKRHHFVPYKESFIRAQVKHFAPEHQAKVYLARYNNECVAASVHMSVGGVTSYHHGASTHKYEKIPASYLLQWTAIQDALRAGDDIYNFWGIAPPNVKKHPFTGVTTFKTGFGGKPLPLVHCMDIPLSKTYFLTRAFETMRKWKRGF